MNKATCVTGMVGARIYNHLCSCHDRLIQSVMVGKLPRFIPLTSSTSHPFLSLYLLSGRRHWRSVSLLQFSAATQCLGWGLKHKRNLHMFYGRIFLINQLRWFVTKVAMVFRRSHGFCSLIVLCGIFLGGCNSKWTDERLCYIEALPPPAVVHQSCCCAFPQGRLHTGCFCVVVCCCFHYMCNVSKRAFK